MLCLRLFDSTNTIAFRCFLIFYCLLQPRHFAKSKGLNSDCCLIFMDPSSVCSKFLSIPCWVWPSSFFVPLSGPCLFPLLKGDGPLVLPGSDLQAFMWMGVKVTEERTEKLATPGSHTHTHTCMMPVKCIAGERIQRNVDPAMKIHKS